MTIGKRIKKQREYIGLTQTELADAISSTKQNIYKYENDIITNIPSDKIEAMARILETTPAYLMGWESNTSSNVFWGSPLPNTVKRPRLGVISCGEPIMAEENFDGYDDVPENIKCDFTLKCEGDSMIGARIHDGDIVYIKKQSTVENGQVAAVLIDGSEKLLKRVYISGESIVLQAENPKYAPIIFYGIEMSRVSIIGRAVGFTSIL